MLKIVHWDNPTLTREDIFYGDNGYVVDQLLTEEEYNTHVDMLKVFAEYVAIWGSGELLYYGKAKYLSKIPDEPSAPVEEEVYDTLYDSIIDAITVSMDTELLRYVFEGKDWRSVWKFNTTYSNGKSFLHNNIERVFEIVASFD